jgi:hypothetical protein
MKQIKDDPVIDEIREIRHRISERFGHGPEKPVAYYMEPQKQYEDRLIKTESDVEQTSRDPGISAKKEIQMTEDYRENTARQGDRAAFDRVLAKVPSVPPDPWDGWAEETPLEKAEKKNGER